MAKTIGDLLQAKGNQVWTASPEQTALEAVRRMSDHDAGALVITEGDRVAGIVTERDFVRKVALAGRSFESTRLGDIMTREVLYLKPEQTVDEAMAVMTSRRVRHLPVLAEGRLAGMVSIRDLIGEMVAEKDFVISQLEHYIRGH